MRFLSYLSTFEIDADFLFALTDYKARAEVNARRFSLPLPPPPSRYELQSYSSHSHPLSHSYSYSYSQPQAAIFEEAEEVRNHNSQSISSDSSGNVSLHRDPAIAAGKRVEKESSWRGGGGGWS